MSILSVTSLGKCYFPNVSGARKLLSLCGLRRLRLPPEWVFRNVSFEVNKGEIFGVIGLNGEGKSTLLKVIAGVLMPNEGSVRVKGHVSSILELGLGFRPDLSGRQNALHLLVMGGLDLKMAHRVLPAVENFASIGEMFDKPVRLYSSGMQMRLAFSICVAGPSDLLLVDEAISVGDIYFQQKCFDKIKELAKNGVAIVLVSHDPNVIRALCSRAILLSGEKQLVGSSRDIIDLYEGSANPLKNMSSSMLSLPGSSLALENHERRSSVLINDGTVRSVSVKVLGSEQREQRYFSHGEHVTISVKFRLSRHLEKPIVGFIIKDVLGRDIFTCDTARYFKVDLMQSKGAIEAYVSFPNVLASGLYFVSLSLVNTWVDGDSFQDEHYLGHRLVHFCSHNQDSDRYFCGVFDLNPSIQVGIPYLQKKMEP